MEKIAKDIYELNCKWFADGSGLVEGDAIDGWVANVVCFDDNSCIGYAKDDKMQTPTHLIIGTFVDGAGLSICKIHASNGAYDPIIFDAFINETGNKGTYYGEFLSQTIFNVYPLGLASIDGKKKESTSQEISKILDLYEQMKNDIKLKVGNHPAHILAAYESMDYREMAAQIRVIAEAVKKETLPEIFKNRENMAQPSGMK